MRVQVGGMREGWMDEGGWRDVVGAGKLGRAAEDLSMPLPLLGFSAASPAQAVGRE